MLTPSYFLTMPAGDPVSGRMGVRGPVPDVKGARIVVVYDAMHCADRTFRRVGSCWMCGRILWNADDGQGAEVWATSNRLDAEDYGQSGPSVGLCLECANDGRTYERALTFARGAWSDYESGRARLPENVVITKA